MVILGEVCVDCLGDPFGTSYVDFYASMIKVPFLGTYFNTMMPLFILIFGFIFALLSIFKLKSKTLSVFKRYSKSKEEKERESKMTEKEK